ncbi:cyclase family protein [Sporomusa acidovorans]|uniref:Cyclase n=1 Tax=Sporomusa acidovorans (strain ATCC 49682 / DSM 3132 / Mol) TaxID=1123286 RepID=A0ABZ3J4Z1_SPOA4|nr:cyclase family protein [Sporomusa acidovorans]OZC18263.1 putative cyclase [Sporomusa acidovorans DSM 3132]SDF26144.1 Kynurenine formamidase [Sporomusa acidovorans]
MKIDLSVTVTEEILNLMVNMTAAGQIPPVAKFGHIGTHFDAMDKKFSLENTERNGKLFDVSHVKGRDIEAGDIHIDEITEHDFIMFYTGYLKEKKYGTPEYCQSHPELSNALISDLINKKVSMIGIDFAGIRKPAEHHRADQYCADHGVFVIENLANLETLLAAAKGQTFIVHTYPVNYEGLTGLPCRVVAEI